MKKSLWAVLAIFILVVSMIGCGPAKVEVFEEIKANETAFLVPLEGASKSKQAEFMSVKYLEENKVAAKRISIPIRKHKTGRLWFDFEYIPTMKVIKVNRAPVTREWTGDEGKGSSRKNEALWVESNDSIGFGIGVNITGMVKEEDTPLFLYTFAGTPLSIIIDQNVRGFINSILSQEFARHDLEVGRGKKNEIFEIASNNTIPYFKKMGITIASLGLAEGMIYRDTEIQEAINNAFTAEMNIKVQEQERLAQAEINEKNVDIATAERRAADEFAKAAEARKKQAEVEISIMLAKAKLMWVEKWDGKLPEKMLPDNASVLFNMD